MFFLSFSIRSSRLLLFLFFFFNDTATTEIYTLSLHDALPIWPGPLLARHPLPEPVRAEPGRSGPRMCFAVRLGEDRKSTRLNSSHANISYAVFCLKKKILLKTVQLTTQNFDPHRPSQGPCTEF